MNNWTFRFVYIIQTHKLINWGQFGSSFASPRLNAPLRVRAHNMRWRQTSADAFRCYDNTKIKWMLETYFFFVVIRFALVRIRNAVQLLPFRSATPRCCAAILHCLGRFIFPIYICMHDKDMIMAARTRPMQTWYTYRYFSIPLFPRFYTYTCFVSNKLPPRRERSISGTQNSAKCYLRMARGSITDWLNGYNA